MGRDFCNLTISQFNEKNRIERIRLLNCSKLQRLLQNVRKKKKEERRNNNNNNKCIYHSRPQSEGEKKKGGGGRRRKKGKRI